MRGIITILFLALGNLLLAQVAMYKGEVKDNKNNPIISATVFNKQMNISVKSNQNGVFQIKGSVGDSIRFSALGYQSLWYVLKANKTSNIAISLELTTQEIDEVRISTGYQTIQKERMTGSYYQLDNDLVNRGVSSNVLDRLKNVVPGMNFNKDIPKITIRGVSTIHGNESPLIVVDNFPYEGNIDDINPETVESISVLKDAAAAAIWGARAGNGVIVITTKRATDSATPRVNFASNVGVAGRGNLYYHPSMSVSDYIDTEVRLFEEGAFESVINNIDKPPVSEVVQLLYAHKNNEITQQDLDSRLDFLRTKDVRVDQNKYLYRNSVDIRSFLDIQGGSNRHDYSISLGYDNNIASNVGLSNNRKTLWVRDNFKFMDSRLQVGLEGMVVYLDNILDGQGVVSGMSPYETYTDEQGNPKRINHGYNSRWLESMEAKGFLNWGYSPIEELASGDRVRKNRTYQMNASLKFTILSGLDLNLLYQKRESNSELRAHMGLDQYFTRDFINRYTQIGAGGALTYPVPVAGILDVDRQRGSSENVRAVLNYNKDWGLHSLQSLVGIEQREGINKGDKDRWYGYEEEYERSALVNYHELYAQSYNDRRRIVIPYGRDQSHTVNRFRSYYGTLNYSYANTYVFSGSVRKDQSNIFGVASNMKGVPLYSFGLNWNLHRESFMDWLDGSKLSFKASYGYNGNVDNTLSSEITARYYAGTASILPRAEIVNPPNEMLRWERVRIKNIGLNWLSARQRIDASLEYYTKEGLDLLGDSPLPASSGIVEFRGNTANTEGKGVELTLNALILDKTFKWRTSFMFSYSQEHVTRYFLDVASVTGLVEYGSRAYPIVSKPRYALFSYEWAGLDPTNGNPLGILDGAPSADYVKILNTASLENIKYEGPSLPPYYGSLTNTLQWKSLQLSLNIGYKLGNYVRFPSIQYAFNYGLGGHGDIYKRWMQPGDEMITSVPSMPESSGNSQRDRLYKYSSVLVDRGDYIRWNDLRLSYHIPTRLAGWLKNMQSLQVYGHLQNLGVLWVRNKRGLDPEALSGYPAPLMTTLGFRLNF